MMMNGSCLCGTVRWVYRGAFDRITHCHCGMCRKAHAAAFATYAIGAPDCFAFEAGEDQITQYRYSSSAGFVRSFCSICGSVVPNTHLGDIVALPAGGLDGELGIEPAAHIFVKWQAPWHTITDELVQHDNYPGQTEPAVERNGPPSSTDGVVRGSCLCGDIAYEVVGEFASVHNCHCSRCRRAHASAHATNGFTALDAVQFTRGEQHLIYYQHPDAGLFAQHFCRQCGAGMPQLIAEIPAAMVPFGTLDDDPNRRADDHIYVGSKSTWYPITDGLPQFQTVPD